MRIRWSARGRRGARWVHLETWESVCDEGGSGLSEGSTCPMLDFSRKDPFAGRVFAVLARLSSSVFFWQQDCPPPQSRVARETHLVA